MSKTLKLANGTEIVATVSSTIEDIEVPVQSFAAVDELLEELIPANLSVVTFDGRAYQDLGLIGVGAEKSGEKIFARIALELCVEDRIEDAKRAAVDAYTMQLIEEGLL